MNAPKYTGERVIPESMNPRNGLLMEHIARYEFAAEFARGRVLDMGCGVGYGMEIILDLADDGAIKEILGLDIDQDSIAYARSMYGYQKAVFEMADARQENLGRQYGLFDTIVCFEVIEHILEEEALIRNLNQMLLPGGHLMISTPYGQGKGKPCSCPFHVHQYTEEEFLNLLSPYFNVTLYGQRDQCIEQKRATEKYYLMIAVCTK